MIDFESEISVTPDKPTEIKRTTIIEYIYDEQRNGNFGDSRTMSHTLLAPIEEIAQDEAPRNRDLVGFRTHLLYFQQIQLDGITVELTSGPLQRSGIYYIDGSVSRNQAPGQQPIDIVRTRTGGIARFYPEDRLISSEPTPKP